MAGKRKESTTIPQKWEDVPEIPKEEHPYPLPEGWKWVKLGELTQIIGGGTPSTAHKEYFENGDIPWITPADLSEYTDIYISHGKRNISKKGLENSSARLLPKDSVCLTTRAPIGYVSIANNELCTNQGFKSFLPTKSYLPSYLYWYLKGNKEFLDTFASGTTFLEISGTRAKEIPLPLPPLETQQRIVNRIESLFSKLDEAAEKVQAVIDSHEARKQAILHKAFSGELTKKWRKENISKKSFWSKRTIGDIGFLGSGGTPTRKNKAFYNGTVPWVKTGEINWNYISYTDEHITDEAIQKSSAKIYPEGTVLVAMYGQGFTRGRAAILNIPAAINQAVCAIRPKDFINSRFIFYFFMYKYNELRNKAIGGVQPNYNLSMISSQIILLPEFEEQNQIVDILDRLLTNEQQVQGISEIILDKITYLKMTIMGKSFKGEIL